MGKDYGNKSLQTLRNFLLRETEVESGRNNKKPRVGCELAGAKLFAGYVVANFSIGLWLHLFLSKHDLIDCGIKCSVA